MRAGALRAVLLREQFDIGSGGGAQLRHESTVPSGAATIGASTPRSAAADRLSASRLPCSVTTTAASSCCTPLETAAATAACRADNDSDGNATVAAAYVRPMSSRTAAPS